MDPEALSAEYDITVLHKEPLIVQFEDFLTETEMAALKEMAEPLMAPSTVRLAGNLRRAGAQGESLRLERRGKEDGRPSLSLECSQTEHMAAASLARLLAHGPLCCMLAVPSSPIAACLRRMAAVKGVQAERRPRCKISRSFASLAAHRSVLWRPRAASSPGHQLMPSACSDL